MEIWDNIVDNIQDWDVPPEVAEYLATVGEALVQSNAPLHEALGLTGSGRGSTRSKHRAYRDGMWLVVTVETLKRDNDWTYDYTFEYLANENNEPRASGDMHPFAGTAGSLRNKYDTACERIFGKASK